MYTVREISGEWKYDPRCIAVSYTQKPTLREKSQQEKYTNIGLEAWLGASHYQPKHTHTQTHTNTHTHTPDQLPRGALQVLA